MFHFKKKMTKFEDIALEEITEEQLRHIAGGVGGTGLLNVVNEVTGLAVPLLDGLTANPTQTQVGSVTVNTPGITPLLQLT